MKTVLQSFCALALVTAIGFSAMPEPAAASGALKVAADISYPPLEFYGPPSHSVQGFDIDLMNALAEKLGARTDIANRQFDSILHSVQSGGVDIGISALSDTRDREKLVDFVDYLLVGSGMLVPSGNPRRIFNLGALCGLRVDVQQGTSQEAALNEQSQRCESLHLGKILLTRFPSDELAFAAFQSGKTDVHVTDYPVVVYLAKTSENGTKYQIAGSQFALVPYGIAVRKSNTALREHLVQALHEVIADGTYQKLLKKWGLGQGALRSAPVNAGTLFDK